MHAAAKSALKDRTKAWKHQQKQGFADVEDMLSQKCAFLEDILTLYQEEVARLTSGVSSGGSRVRASSAFGGGTDTTMTGSAADASERNAAVADAAHYYDLFASAQKEIKQLSDEVAYLRGEQSKVLSKATEDFQKALGRNNERHQQSMRLAIQEAEMERSKIAALEAELQQIKAERDAVSAEEVMVAQNQIESMERELNTTRRDLSTEQRRAADLEKELSVSRRRAAQASEFMNQIDGVAQRISTYMAKQSTGHKRLVNSLLTEDRAATGGGGRAEDESGDNDKDNADPSSSGNVNADSEIERKAHQIMAKLKVAGGSISSTEKLMQLLQAWEAEGEAQQLELAVAVRCAQEQHQKQERDTNTKLMESFGHCELLMQRIQQMDAQHSEMREFIQQERDRALDVRDRAVVMVRAMEQAKDRRAAVVTVGVQTARSELTR